MDTTTYPRGTYCTLDRVTVYPAGLALGLRGGIAPNCVASVGRYALRAATASPLQAN